MSRADYNPDWIPPPGATVDDFISRGRAPRSLFSERLGEAGTRMLLNGEAPIDADLAAFLAASLGPSASFWLEREKLYRAALVQRHAEEQLLGELPLDDMRMRALVKPLHSHAETVAEVVEFFGSEDAESCQKHIQELPAIIQQKTSRSIVSRPGSLAAWVRAGEIIAGQMQCDGWDRERLREILPDIRRLTRTQDPKKYLPELRQLCQRFGIALVTLRALNGCRARAVIKFLSPTKVMLLLSYRHLTDDQFWFSLAHELGHLVLHSDEETIYDDWEESSTVRELEADQFAADALIPPEYHHELPSLRGDRSIIAFARRIGVSRGIVVGQMQHRKLCGFDKLNHLKVHYQWNAQNEIEKRAHH